MQNGKDLLDDLATIATGAMGSGLQIKEQIKTEMRQHIVELIDKQDLVPREDFIKLEGMLKKARLQIDALEARIAELENK